MEQQEKEKFLNFLSSCNYKKGNEFLKETIKNTDYYTLLGVFSDYFKIAVKADWIKNPFIKDKTTYYLMGELRDVSKIIQNKISLKPKEYEILKKCQAKFLKEPDFTKELIYLQTNFK